MYRLIIWQTMTHWYNEEANKQNMETRTLTKVFTMARSIRWCRCSDDNKDNCSCLFFKVPNFDDMTVPSTSGSLGKRSYDAISSPDDSDSLRDQVVELINSLLSSKHIYEVMSYTAGQFYDNMIKKGRNMFIKMILKEHDVTAKLAHMERDMRRYPDCM